MEYIIWNPNGENPPRVRFRTRQAAQQEAERLARGNPGAQFYVCALVSVSRVQTIETVQLDGMSGDSVGISL